ncbi:MAG: hypothetical protein ACU837_14370 [Gammaproteobacteria bacterium]
MSGGRNSTATNANTGNSYQGSTQYQNGQGVTHSGACYDGNGNPIACPTK